MTAIWTTGSEADFLAFMQTWSGVACDVRYNPHAAPERQFEFRCAADPDRAATPTKTIKRLIDEPVVNGMHTYLCEGCGEKNKGNDRVGAHMEWRRKHWVECFGMTPQAHWYQ